jgi:hypothetical protein
MLKAIAAWRIHSVRWKLDREAEKNRTPKKAPIGKPMKRRSKNREGMIKKLRSFQTESVKRTVAKERRNMAVPTRQGATGREPSGRGGIMTGET